MSKELPKVAKRFGWDWWAWNLLLASTPPTILWYNLAKTKSKMKDEVARLKEAIEAERIQKESLKAIAQGQSKPSQQAAISTTDERLQQLEIKLAELDRHLKGDGELPSTIHKGKGEEGGSEEKTQAKAAEAGGGTGQTFISQAAAAAAVATEEGETHKDQTGVQRRIYEQYSPDVLAAFERFRGGGTGKRGGS